LPPPTQAWARARSGVTVIELMARQANAAARPKLPSIARSMRPIPHGLAGVGRTVMVQLESRPKLHRLHRLTQIHQAPLECGGVNARWTKPHLAKLRRTHRPQCLKRQTKLTEWAAAYSARINRLRRLRHCLHQDDGTFRHTASPSDDWLRAESVPGRCGLWLTEYEVEHTPKRE